MSRLDSGLSAVPLDTGLVPAQLATPDGSHPRPRTR